MRNLFAKTVTALAGADERVVLLSGDIGNRLFDDFKAKFPTRFFNCGIAEANMIGVAAGLAMNGYRPFAYTIAPFTTTRCLEQIKLDLCYQHLPVVIAGTGAGLSYAELGPTHHTFEDLAILRPLPHMTLFCPCDPLELQLGMAASLTLSGPLYLRLGKKGEPALHAAPPAFQFGRAETLRDGADVALLATGPIAAEALRAAELLAAEGITARVASLHTVKPLDLDYLGAVFAATPLVVTVEEHSRIGGLGGAVAEWLAAAEPRPAARFLSLGIEDRFLPQVPSQEEARRVEGLTGEAIAAAVIRRLGRPAA